MIKIEYVKKRIYVVPDADSFETLTALFDGCEFAVYVGGVYEIKPIYMDELSDMLRPYSKDLSMSTDFREFAAEFRLRNTEVYDSGAKGTVVLYAYINKTVIKSRIFPHEALDKKMSYFLKSAKNSKKFQEGKWDGVIHLLDPRSKKTFPTGLLFIAKEVLIKEGYGYKIVYKYNVAPPAVYKWYVDDGITPDPDQIEAVNKAYAARRSVVKAPTGFGKDFCRLTGAQ